MNKYVLLLDSSDVNLSVGILNNEELVYKNDFYAWQRQSEYMIPEINKALEATKIELKDISRVVLGIGPGSYTGVRIPLTIAKTMFAVNKVEVLALSSLKIMGNSNEKYISLRNARSNRSYIGIYDRGKDILPDQIVNNADIDSIIRPYLDQGFVLKGNIEYLHSYEQNEFSVIDGLKSYAFETIGDKNIDSLCPVYLKDDYGNNWGEQEDN